MLEKKIRGNEVQWWLESEVCHPHSRNVPTCIFEMVILFAFRDRNSILFPTELPKLIKMKIPDEKLMIFENFQFDR